MDAPTDSEPGRRDNHARDMHAARMGMFPHQYQGSSSILPSSFALPSLDQKSFGSSNSLEASSDELSSELDISSIHTDFFCQHESSLDTIQTTTSPLTRPSRADNISIFSQITFGSDFFSLAPSPFDLEEGDHDKDNTTRLTTRAVPASSIVFDYSHVACRNDYQVPVGYFGHDHGRPTQPKHHHKLRRRYHSVHHRQSIRKFYTLAALQQLLQDEGESEKLKRLRIVNEKQSESVSTNKEQIKTKEPAFSQLRAQRHRDTIQGMAVLTKDKLIRAGISVRRWKDGLNGSSNGEKVRRLSSFRISTQPSSRLNSHAQEKKVDSQEVLGQDEAISQASRLAKSFIMSSVLEKALDMKWTRSIAAGSSMKWRPLTQSLRQTSQRLSDQSLSILTTNDESVFFAEIDKDDCGFADTKPLSPSKVHLVSEMDASSSCRSSHNAGNLVGLHWMDNRLRSTDDEGWFSCDDLSTYDYIDTTLSSGKSASTAAMGAANRASPLWHDDKETTIVSDAKSEEGRRSRTSKYSATSNRSRWMNRSTVSLTFMNQKRDKLGGSQTGSETKKSIKERECGSS